MDCTNGTNQFAQDAATNATAVTAGGQELGQSFTAPCTGYLDVVTPVFNWSVAPSTPFGATVLVYSGEGTGGTLLGAAPFTFTNQASGASFLNITLADPVAVTEGQVYTFFVDMTSGTTGMQYSTANPYAGGTTYAAADGNPATATAQTGVDLQFRLSFKAPVTATQPAVFNGPGWRLLSNPVRGITVNDLAAINLVQGIPAGNPASFYPAQYPTDGSNLRTSYVSGGTFNPPASTATVPLSGAGYFWYWYDVALGPNPSGGGTSFSRELTGFTLSASGPAVIANTGVSFALRADGFYMMGNPFAAPLALTGVTKTVGDGTLGTVFYAFDPSIGTDGNYVQLFTSNPGNGGASDYAAVWQGFFGRVTGGTTAPTITYLVASTNAGVTPPFYGRGADAVPYVQLTLDGTTASGAVVRDVAAWLRFLPDADAGWDAHDASKLAPPFDGVHALIAPVGERDGAPERLGVNSLPFPTHAPVSVPVAFTTDEAGEFTLSWAGAAELPEGWTATLTDLATGAAVDLRATPGYAFAAAAGAWTERFALTIGPAAVTATEPVAEGAFRLGAVVPNPTAGAASLALRVGTAQDVRATVYDALGRAVAVVFDGPATPAADVVVALDGARLAPGAYVVRVEGATFSEARRVTVVR